MGQGTLFGCLFLYFITLGNQIINKFIESPLRTIKNPLIPKN